MGAREKETPMSSERSTSTEPGTAEHLGPAANGGPNGHATQMLSDELPPGSRAPALWQTIATWTRPTASVDRARRRFGPRFATKLLGQPRQVVISDPEELKELFTAPPDVIHPGEGARLIESTVGPNSVILLDEAPHLEQRRLLLPAFHGEQIDKLERLMVELSERELANWPRDEPVALHPRLQRLTLEIVLRAVFGLEQGARLERLRDLLTELLSFGDHPISLLPFAQRAFAGRGVVGRFEAVRGEADAMIFQLIDERRGSGEEGPDVLALLLAARHEDGEPMSAAEVRDELVTALVAGHETTASQLSWAFDLLAWHPAVAERVAAEAAAGEDDAYLTATIQEAMRRRPVLLNAEPRLVVKPIRIGGVSYPPGVVLMASIQLLHHNPEIYPDPYAFRPERFLESPPGTYTWIPFGGGRRRCIGASFAMLEMKVVLRIALALYSLQPAADRPATARRRGITVSPSNGATVILHARDADATDAHAQLAAHVAVAG